MVFIKENTINGKIDLYKEEIYERNCKSFISLGFGGIIITAVIFLSGILLSKYTEFGLEYGLFFLYMLAFYGLAKFCYRKRVNHIRLIYYIAITPIMIGGILMGSVLDPKQPAITIMILICVLTLFIIDKPIHLLLYILLIDLIFIISCQVTKSKVLFEGDMIDLMIYSCISIGVNYFSLKERVDSSMNYCKMQIKSEQDSLTNLLNRGSGEEQSKELVRNNIMGTFAILDVDNFKSFNDTYGHQIGDEVICLLADKLKDNFRNQDVVFRLGGDEFAVYAPGLTERHICERHFDRLRKSLQLAKLSIKDQVPISISIGCTIYASGNADYETLYRKSDELLYEAKNTGKGKMIVDRL